MTVNMEMLDKAEKSLPIHFLGYNFCKDSKTSLHFKLSFVELSGFFHGALCWHCLHGSWHKTKALK